MARDTQISEGLHVVKLQTTGDRSVITLPRDIRARVGFVPEAGFIAVRAVGPVVVLAQVTEGTKDGIERQSAELIDQAVNEWVREFTKHAASKSQNANGETARG